MPSTSLLIIHGGDAYNSDQEFLDATLKYPPRFSDGSRRWKTNLITELNLLYDVHYPQFPCRVNAQYEIWEIVFNKILEMPEINDDIAIVAHSLGANFIQKYLGKHTISKKISQLHFISGCIGEGNFTETDNWENISSQCNDIHIWHSTDDPVVDYSCALHYKDKLTESTLHKIEGRKHFSQEYFPELTAHLTNKKTS